jgi:hypothetical protein
MRLILDVTGTTSNNKRFTIQRIVSPQKVQVFETVADEGPLTCTCKLVRPFTGDMAFDGNVANEGLTFDPVAPIHEHSDPWATVVNGQKWKSADSAGPHIIGRIWGTSKQIRGITLVMPPGITREYLPDEFIIQILDGGVSPPGTLPDDLEPVNDAHWTTVATKSGGEAVNIYAGGQYGYEYDFGSPTSACYGIRLNAIYSEDNAQQVQLAQFMVWEEVGAGEGFPITFSSEQLKLSLDAGTTDLYIDIPDNPSTSDLDELAAVLNQALVGYEVEAVVGEHRFLKLRSTVGGDNSTLRVYNNTTSVKLGLTSGSDVNQTGRTDDVRKLHMNALTIIYRFSVWGNKPLAV